MGRVLQQGFNAERLEPSDWSRFDDIPANGSFRLGGKTWKKLGCEELAAVIGVERWTVRRPSGPESSH
jgi:hypothetical protein